jgi:hypothetical protein
VVLPAALVDTTLKISLHVAAGQAAGGIASGPVAALTEGVLKAMLWTKMKIVAGCVLAVAVLAVGGVVTRHALDAGQPADEPQVRIAKQDKPDQPPKPDKPADKGDAPKPDKPADRADPPKKPEEKTYAFEMRDKPWAAVFEWYAETSGLGFTGSFKPTGTFTFIPPPGKKYTLPEITDIINEGLLSQKGLLVRRNTTFSVLPADEKVDPILIPRVRLEELPKRGKTELISVVIPLTYLKAKDVGPEVKKLLGTFGDIVVMEKANQFVIQDTAGNLAQVNATIVDMEIREGVKIEEAKKQGEKPKEDERKRETDK